MKKQLFALLLVTAMLAGVFSGQVLAVSEEVDEQEPSVVQALDDQSFPVGGSETIEITWSEGGTEKYSYSNKKDPQETGSLGDLHTGSYTVNLYIKEEGLSLMPGSRYTLDLTSVMEWPSADFKVSLSFPDAVDGWFEIEKEYPEGSFNIGRLKVSDDGILVLELYEDFEYPDGWWTRCEFTANLTWDGDDAADVSVIKNGSYDPASDTIRWTIEAVIPAYTGGVCHTWRIDDGINYTKIGPTLLNTMKDGEIKVESDQYSGKILPVEEASEGDPFAYYLESVSDDEERLYLLNPCHCTTAACQNPDGTGCGNKYEGTNWCTCWQYRYNTTLTISYAVDVSAFMQWLADMGTLKPTEVENTAILVDNGGQVKMDFAQVPLTTPIQKKETVHPSEKNEYIGTYTITVNPAKSYDYSGMDCITISDRMTNLGYVDGSLSVSDEENEWVILTDEDEVPAAREGNENRFCSVAAKEESAAADGRPQSSVRFKIWYPTDHVYTLTYQAMVLDPEAGHEIGYSNFVSLGSEHIEVNGINEMFTGESGMYLKNLYIYKVDSETGDPLAGAEFGAYLYDDDADDALLTTLVTDEAGTARFHTNREHAPYWVVNTNTLYYFQELTPPDGYRPSNKTCWFYFKEGDGIPAEDLPAEVSEHKADHPDGNLYIEPSDADGFVSISITVPNDKIPRFEQEEEDQFGPDIRKYAENDEDLAGEEPENPDSSGTVRTGDSHSPGLWMALLAGSAGAVFVAYRRRRKG